MKIIQKINLQNIFLEIFLQLKYYDFYSLTVKKGFTG